MVTDAREPVRNYKVPAAGNTIAEEFPRVGDAITAIATDIAALLTSVSQRALLSHAHVIADVTGLQAALDGKQSTAWRPSLDDLTDVTAPSPTSGQVLMRVGSQWQPAAISGLDASVLATGTIDPARIPVITGQATIVSSGDLTALTVGQQAQIGTGTTVATTDGFRWIYTGSGSKTLSSSYIPLADVTPEWDVVANKPTAFNPAAHTHPTNEITGLTAAIAAFVPTGVVQDYVGLSAPSGWLLLDGRTIGNASSGATARANADTQALFELLWNSFANAQAAVSGGRGASATADFNANKTITVPDARGRATFGRDNMGGTAASRVTSAGSGIDGTVMGNAGGAQSHTLSQAEMPSHNHTGATDTQGSHTHTVQIGNNAEIPNVSGMVSASFASANGTGGLVNSAGAHAHNLSINNTGGGGAHNNMPPALVLNKIIKL